MKKRNTKLLAGKSVQLRAAPIRVSRRTDRHEANKRWFVRQGVKRLEMEGIYTLTL
jgi:hypothetical protein